jgi:hypothetical protein
MYFLAIIFLIGFIAYMLYLFILAWFLESRILRLLQRNKQKHIKYFPFIPKKLFDLLYFNNHRSIAIWYLRVMTCFGLIILFINLYLLVFNYNH